MAKGVYVGVGGVTKKVKSLYVGVNNVPRKVKKTFIGANGVAKLAYNQEPTYYGAITPLPYSAQDMAGASNGEYAIFSGGKHVNGLMYTNYSNVTAYNKALVQTKATALSRAKHYHGSARSGNRVVFAGGRNSSNQNDHGSNTYLYTVEAYDQSLVKTDATPFTYRFNNGVVKGLSIKGKSYFAHTYFNDDGFGGGYITRYDESLVQTEVTAEIFSNSYKDYTKTKNHMLFLWNANSSIGRTYAFDENIVKTQLTALSTIRDRHTGASNGKHALFGGGYTYVSGVGGSPNSVVDAFNEDLVLLPPLSLSAPRVGMSGDADGANAFFIGGYPMPTNTNSPVVDYFDQSLVRNNFNVPDLAKSITSSVELDGKLLIAGGYNNSTYVAYNTVNVIEF